MPHCVIEYSQELVEIIDIKKLMAAVDDGASDSGLFNQKDIKTRALPYKHYRAGTERHPFVHTIIYLLSGRTVKQKQKLSNRILENKIQILPNIQNVSVDDRDMETDTYNKLKS